MLLAEKSMIIEEPSQLIQPATGQSLSSSMLSGRARSDGDMWCGPAAQTCTLFLKSAVPNWLQANANAGMSGKNLRRVQAGSLM